MVKMVSALLVAALLGGCSMLSAVSNLLPGGGDGVNANAQIGAENNQAVAQIATGDEISTGDNSSVTQTEVETANEVQGTQINHNDLPWWVWVLIGWMIPTPARIVCENFMDWRQCRGRK
jgi:hypothetical protein